MKLMTHKPYIIFWALIPIMLIYGFYLSDKTLDLNIHDTYFVISKLQIWYLMVHIFAIYGILYWFIINFNRKTINFLTSTHLIITISGILLLVIASPLFSNTSKELRLITDKKEIILMTQSIVILIILLAQFLFLGNIILGIFRQNKPKNI